jgi:hypothetical protein
MPRNVMLKSGAFAITKPKTYVLRIQVIEATKVKTLGLLMIMLPEQATIITIALRKTIRMI